MILRTAILQWSVRVGQIAYNEKKFKELAQKAIKEEAKILVLPELWNCGYDLNQRKFLAQSIQEGSMSKVREFCSQNKVMAVAGSILEKKQDDFLNTMAVIDNEGDFLQKYRKIHLFEPELAENEFLTAGDEWGLFPLDSVKAGMMLCYDLRFPELARNLRLREAEVIFISAQFPHRRLDHWRILCQARAIENQVYIVAANNGGENFGHSLFIDPQGNILKESQRSEEVLISDLDFDKVVKARAWCDFIEDRRPILDEIDDSLL